MIATLHPHLNTIVQAVLSPRRKVAVLTIVPLLMIFHAMPAHASNLVFVGGFESNGGVGEMDGAISFATGWTVGATVDGTPNPFDFIVDMTADSSGFASEFSPPNLLLWGPDTPFGLSSPTVSFPAQHPIGPIANGFTSSPDGGAFVGVDVTYGNAPLSQLINGLTVGDKYALSFDYAGAQFTDALGASTVGWQMTFGSDTASTPILSNVSQGFTGWQIYTATFTATSTSEILSLRALGGPAGPDPFALIDGVSLTAAAIPEPASMLLLLSGFFGVFVFSRLRKNRS
jgi:PEP-CTERM motif